MLLPFPSLTKIKYPDTVKTSPGNTPAKISPEIKAMATKYSIPTANPSPINATEIDTTSSVKVFSHQSSLTTEMSSKVIETEIHINTSTGTFGLDRLENSVKSGVELNSKISKIHKPNSSRVVLYSIASSLNVDKTKEVDESSSPAAEHKKVQEETCRASETGTDSGMVYLMRL